MKMKRGIQMGLFHKGQMSDSLLTAVFVVLSGGFQDAYTYVFFMMFAEEKQ